MSAPAIHDANFYELVHKVLTKRVEQELDECSQRERRVQDRQPFPSVQCIAPIVDGRVPHESDMAEVYCHDISTSGLSYYAACVPTSEQLLVKLTVPNKVTYLTAQLAHCMPIADGGEAAFLVGIRFTGRVDI